MVIKKFWFKLVEFKDNFVEVNVNVEFISSIVCKLRFSLIVVSESVGILVVILVIELPSDTELILISVKVAKIEVIKLVVLSLVVVVSKVVGSEIQSGTPGIA